jgi:hypothetical protein
MTEYGRVGLSISIWRPVDECLVEGYVEEAPPSRLARAMKWTNGLACHPGLAAALK